MRTVRVHLVTSQERQEYSGFTAADLRPATDIVTVAEIVASIVE